MMASDKKSYRYTSHLPKEILLSDALLTLSNYNKLLPKLEPSNEKLPDVTDNFKEFEFDPLAHGLYMPTKLNNIDYQININKWTKELSSFTYNTSSFANLLNKRYQLLIDQSQQSQNNNINKEQQEIVSEENISNTDEEWDKLGEIINVKLWPLNLKVFIEELLNKFPLFTLRLLSKSKGDSFITSLLQFIKDNSSNTSNLAFALTALLAFTICSANPSYILIAINQLLLFSNDEIYLSPDFIAPYLNILQYYEYSLKVSAPFASAEINSILSIFLYRYILDNVKMEKYKSKAHNNSICSSSDGKFIFLHSDRGLEKFNASLFLSKSELSDPAVCRNESYRPTDICSLACIQNKLYVWISKNEWPTVEVVDALTLKFESILQLGIDPENGTPFSTSYEYDCFTSDGRFLYLVELEQSGSSNKESKELELTDKKNKLQKSKTNKQSDSKNERIVVYVYDPLSKSMVDEVDPWKSSHELSKRLELAEEMSISSNYVWSVQCCSMALKACKYNINDACMWIMERNEELRFRKKCPLVKRLLLPHIFPELNFDSLSRSIKIATGHQLVLILAPEFASSQYFIRAFALLDNVPVCYDTDGNKLSDQDSNKAAIKLPFAKLKSNLKANCAVASAACYDWVNDVIWINKNSWANEDSRFSAYKNFGPGFIPNFNESYNHHSSLVTSRESSMYRASSHEALLKTIPRVRYQAKVLIPIVNAPKAIELKSTASEILNTFSEMPMDYLDISKSDLEKNVAILEDSPSVNPNFNSSKPEVQSSSADVLPISSPKLTFQNASNNPSHYFEKPDHESPASFADIVKFIMIHLDRILGNRSLSKDNFKILPFQNISDSNDKKSKSKKNSGANEKKPTSLVLPLIKSTLCPDICYRELFTLDIEMLNFEIISKLLVLFCSNKSYEYYLLYILKYLSRQLSELSLYDFNCDPNLELIFKQISDDLENIRSNSMHSDAIINEAITAFVSGFNIFYSSKSLRISNLSLLVEKNSVSKLDVSDHSNLWLSVVDSLINRSKLNKSILDLVLDLHDEVSVRNFTEFISKLLNLGKCEALSIFEVLVKSGLENKCNLTNEEERFFNFKMNDSALLVLEYLKEIFELLKIENSVSSIQTLLINLIELFINSIVTLFQELVLELTHIKKTGELKFIEIVSILGSNDCALRKSYISLATFVLTVLSSPKLCDNVSLIQKVLVSAQNLFKSIDNFTKLVPNCLKSFNSFEQLLKDENRSPVLCQSPHPYPSGLQVYSETIVMSGASSILVTFDERTSTLNEQDIVYIDGKDPLQKLSYFGNKTAKNSQWPQGNKCVINGDTVTVSFNAFSQSPDSKTDWGFKCIIKGLYETNLNWIADLQLTCASLASKLISKMIVHNSEIDTRSYNLFLPLVANKFCNYGLEATSSSGNLLQLFIENDSYNNKLQSFIDNVHFRFIGDRVVNSLQNDIKNSWRVALRYLVVVFIKHFNLTDEIENYFTSSFSNEKNLDIRSKIEQCVIEAKKLQEWMISEVQLLKIWKHFHDNQENFSHGNNEADASTIRAVILDDFESEFQDIDRLKSICALKNVQVVESFTGINKDATISNLFSMFIKEVEDKAVQIDPYLQITIYLIDLCKVLLSFKSNDNISCVNDESSSDDEGDILTLSSSKELPLLHSISQLSLTRTNSRLHTLESTIDLIPSMKRTLSDRSKTISDAIGESFETNTLHRTLSKWKNSKHVMTDSSSTIKNNFELFVKLFKSHVDPISLHRTALLHQDIAKVRAAALKNLLEFISSTDGNFCIYPFLGLLYSSLLSLCGNCKFISVIGGVELSSTSFKTDLYRLYDDILEFYFKYLPFTDGLAHVLASPDIFGLTNESISLKFTKKAFLKIFILSFRQMINNISSSNNILKKNDAVEPLLERGISLRGRGRGRSRNQSSRNVNKAQPSIPLKSTMERVITNYWNSITIVSFYYLHSENKPMNENVDINEMLLEILEEFVVIYLKNITLFDLKNQFIYATIIKIIQNMFMRIAHNSDLFATSRERIAVCLISIIKFKYDNLYIVVPSQLILSSCRLLRKIIIDMPPSSAISLKNPSISSFCNSILIPLLGKLLYSENILDEKSTFSNLFAAIKNDDTDISNKPAERDFSDSVNKASLKSSTVLKPFSSILQMSKSFGNVFQQLLPGDIYPREIAEILSSDDAGRLPFLFQNGLGQFEKIERSRKRDHTLGELKGLFALMLHSTGIKDSKKWTDIIIELKRQDFNLEKKTYNKPQSSINPDDDSDEVKSKRLALYLERKACRIGDEISMNPDSKDIDFGVSGLSLLSNSNFASCASNVSVKGKGKWYYEVIIETPGLKQIGFANANFSPAQSGDGVGDCANSWGVDLYRNKTWHAGSKPFAIGRFWEEGDIIGCGLDLDEGTITFYLNGDKLGTPFNNINKIDSYSPAISLSGKERASIVFSNPVYLPDGYFPFEGDSDLPLCNPEFLRSASSVFQMRAERKVTNAAKAFTKKILSEVIQGPSILETGTYSDCLTFGRFLLKGLGATVQDLVLTIQPIKLGNQYYCDFDATSSSTSDLFLSTSFGSADIYPVADTQKLDNPLNTRCIEGGFSIATITSELISLYRHLLLSPQWSRSLRSDLNRALTIPFDQLVSEDFKNTLFNGALMILGGFNEPLRVGGLAQIQNSVSLIVSLKASQAHHLSLNEIMNSIATGSSLANIVEISRPYSMTPTSEFIIDGTAFPIDDATLKLFNSLLKSFKCFIESDTNVNCKLNAFDISWRIMYILDNLVTSSVHFSIDKNELLELIKVLASFKNIITKADKAAIVFKLEELRIKLWNANNNRMSFPIAPSFIYPTAIRSDYNPMDRFLSTSINMDILYGQSPYTEIKNISKMDDNKMLKYWEKHIIPKIQEYVRGSFKDYEMLYFFEALRQPLRLGNAPAALEVVNTLCARKVPEHIVFPPLDKDWSALLFEDIMIGQNLELSSSATNIIGYLMTPYIGLSGRIKSLDPLNELALWQVQLLNASIVSEFWVPVECLKLIENGSVSNGLSQSDVLCTLEEIKSGMNTTFEELLSVQSHSTIHKLLSLPGILNLCCNDAGPQNSFDSIWKLVKPCLLDSLQLSNLELLGSPRDAFYGIFGSFSKEIVATLKNNQNSLYEALSCLKELLSSAFNFSAAFTTRKSSSDVDDSYEFNSISERLRSINIPGASALIFTFTRNRSFLAPNATLELCEDPYYFQQSKLYSGGKAGLKSLSPYVFHGNNCYLRLTYNESDPSSSDFTLFVTAISPDLGLAFWIMESLIPSLIYELGLSPEKQNEVLFGLLDVLISTSNIESMAATPLKEALLKSVVKLLQRIVKLGFCTSVEFEKSLKTLYCLKNEIFTLQATETMNSLNPSSTLYTSYFQVLLNAFLLSQQLSNNKMVISFDFDSSKTTEPKVEEAEPLSVWSCDACTFENVLAAPACDICGSPKPKLKLKPQTSISSNASSDESSKILHDLLAVAEVSRFLLGELTLEESPASLALFQAAMSDLKCSHNFKRVFLIEGLQPRSAVFDQEKITSDIKTLLSNSISNISYVNETLVFVDPTKVNEDELLKLMSKMEQPIEKSDDEKSVKLFSPEILTDSSFNFDNNGLLYSLGFKSSNENVEEFKHIFLNPALDGLVKTFSSSLQADSSPITSICGREPVRLVSKPVEQQWFGIDLGIHMKMTVSHYALRHYSSWDVEALRSWYFQGSNSLSALESTPESSWVTLKEHADDKSLCKKNQVYLWEVGSLEGYSKFRIKMTGLNSNKHYYLACSGIELYGEARGECIAELAENKNLCKDSCFLGFETRSKIDEKDFRKALDGTEYKLVPISSASIGSSSSMDFYLLSTIAVVPNMFLPLFNTSGIEESTKVILKPKFKSAIEKIFMTLPSVYYDTTSNLYYADAQAVSEWFALLCDLETEYEAECSDELVSMPFALRLVNYIESSSFPGGISFADISTVLEEECERILVNHKGIERFWNWIKLQGLDSHMVWNFPLNEDNLFTKSKSILLKLIEGQLLSKVTNYLQENAENFGTANLLQLECDQISIIEADIDSSNIIKSLEVDSEFKVCCFRIAFSFIKRFNMLVSNFLGFVDMRFCNDEYSLTGVLLRAKQFMFRSIKTNFLTTVLDSTSDLDAKRPTVTIDRLQLMNNNSSGEILDFGLGSSSPLDKDLMYNHFGHTYNALKDVEPSNLKQPRPLGAEPFYSFTVEFKNEFVVGEAGPWRQLFADISTELQSPHSPILISCPNNVSKVGDNRDKYILRSTAPESLCEHLGLLMGCCIRTAVRMNLNLPSFFWKPLVNEQLSRFDLSCIDSASVGHMKYIESIDKETFNSAIEETFSTQLSDGVSVELIPNGCSIPVEFEDRKSFIDLVEAARLNEHLNSIQAIRRGISKIVPIQMLSLFTWTELELLICGKSVINLELLRRHTEYSGCSPSDNHIKYFWNILESFNDDMKRKFIRFAWAQERIPSDDQEFALTRTRMLIKGPIISGNQDIRLPKADTCFFNVELPRYSSEQIMRNKLLYAMETLNMSADDEPDRDLADE